MISSTPSKGISDTWTDPESGLEFWKQGASAPEEIPLEPQEDFMDDTRGLLEDFLCAVRGEASTYPTGRDRLMTMALTLACAESSKQGKTLDLLEFARGLGLA